MAVDCIDLIFKVDSIVVASDKFTSKQPIAFVILTNTSGASAIAVSMKLGALTSLNFKLNSLQ